MSDDDIYSMKIEETETTATKTKINQKYYPGFACFFENYLKDASISFTQCYEKLLNSQQHIRILNSSLPQILGIQSTNQKLIEKKNKLESRNVLGQNFLHFIKNPQNQNEMNVQLIDYANKQQLQTWKLQLKLREYQKIKLNLIKSKKQQFEQNLRLEQEKLKAASTDKQDK